MRFTKGHGTANDFVLIEDADGALALSDALVAAICDRRRGVGADGVLRVVRTKHLEEYADQAGQAEWFMDYRNADGGAVEMCGNGIRVFARYLSDRGLIAETAFDVATRDGVKHLVLSPTGDVTVDMGPPRDITEIGDAVELSMGNPHHILFVDSLADAPVSTRGAEIEAATPGGTNVEFVVVQDRARLDMRVWERGVGETASCGTGACAAAVAAHVRGRAERSADVHLPGGTLHVNWADDTVRLTGPAELVADGELRPRWLAAHR